MVFPESFDKYFQIDNHVGLIKSTHKHAQYLQSRLRTNDMIECAIHEITPFRVLHEAVADDDTFCITALYDEEPVCMFGVSPLIPCDQVYETINELRMGNIWMLGSNKLNTIRKSFYKTSKQVVNWLSEEFDYLENVVPLGHKKTILWLSLLGFDVGKGIITINNTECVRFVRCAPNIQVSFQ